MKNTFAICAAAVAAACVLLPAPAWPQDSTRTQPEGGPSAHQVASEEYVLFGDVNVAGGEAEIAVNPKNANNIVVGILAGHHRLADGKLPDGKPSTRDQRLGQPDWTYSVLAVTHDRGATWTFSEDQLRKKFDLCNCFDPIVEAAPDGTFYWGCLPEVSRDGSDYKVKGSLPEGGPVAMRGGSYIMSSSDEGRTWSEPSEIVGSGSAARWPNDGKDMVWALSSPWDRAVVAIDHATGTLYATGHGRGGNPPHQEDSVTASHDNGKTWGPVFNWDSAAPDYPQSGRGNIDAGGGRVAVAYIASKTPVAGAACPCLVFATSKDDGRTFERHVVPGGSPVTGREAFIAADQSKPGRYVVAVVNSGGDQLLLSRTEDYGGSWSAPVAAVQAAAGTTVTTATGAAMAAMKFSTNGQLGMLWRAVHADKSFDVWSSVSRDGGQTFATARVSHATSPPTSRERGHFLVGDDYWDLAFDDEFIHFVWTDSRPGFLATWYGRLPLSAYGVADRMK